VKRKDIIKETGEESDAQDFGEDEEKEFWWWLGESKVNEEAIIKTGRKESFSMRHREGR